MSSYFGKEGPVDIRNAGDLDEFVLECAIHIERMGARDWSVIIGELNLNVRLDKRGFVESVTAIEGVHVLDDLQTRRTRGRR